MVFRGFGVVAGIVEDARLNATMGMFAWAAQRLSGLVLVFYLFLHLWALGAATGGPAAFDERMALFDSGFFAFFESLVVGLVAFHMFNGLRIIAIDFVRLSHLQKQLLRMALAGLVAVMAVSGWIFFDRVFG